MADIVRTLDTGKVRVLVYGTLKSEGTNHALMEKIRAKFIGFDSTSGAIKLKDLGPFPAVFDQSAEEIKKCKGEYNDVRGEVYMMDEEALAHLDFYEGHPNFFERRKLWTNMYKKRVWVYFMRIPSMDDSTQRNVLPDGMWQPSKDEALFWAQYEN